MSNYQILIVDHDCNSQDFLAETLNTYIVQRADDGQEALQAIRHSNFDLIVIDLDVPLVDGLELLHRAKSYDPDVVVVMLAQQTSVNSAVSALRFGAFDYLAKPIRRRDMLAVVESGLAVRQQQLRRKQLEQFAVQMLNQIGTEAPSRAVPEKYRIQTYGALQINSGAYEACMNGDPLNLTPTEFRLLKTLCSTPGVAFTYVKLVEAACGYTCSRQEAREIIGTHVRNLRQKLNTKRNEMYYITSVRGVGYLIRVPKDEREEVCCG